VPEQIRSWSTINLDGRINALHAEHILRYSIEPHWHEEFAVRLIDSGDVQFNHDGKTEHIAAHNVILINPGEVHSADDCGAPSLSFRMVHIPESSFREIVSQRSKLPGSLYFSQKVLSDPSLSRDLSKVLLLRAFRNRFGLPPHVYQLQQRVLQAKRLLKSFSPSYVALECGFSDQSHFTRVSRAHAGTTPRRYAEQFRPICSDNVVISVI
jgi:AraC-like DNA-binding protein